MINTNTKDYDEEEVKFRFAAIRYRAINSHPYLATALLSLTPYIKKIGTFGVDKRWNIYYDPYKIKEWTIDEGKAVLIHEINHILRKHHIRTELMDIEIENLKVANIAQDICINQDLREEGLTLPEGLMLPEKFNLPKNLTWEEYYHLLMKDHVQYIEFCGPDCKDNPNCPNNNNNSSLNNNQNSKGNSKTVRIHIDCGSGAHSHEQDYEEPNSGLDKSDQIIIIKQTAQQIQEHASKHPGSIPAGLMRWAESVVRSKVRWESELRAAFRKGLANKQGMVDFSYQKPSRRQSVFPKTILPAIRKPIPKVTVIIDTSGSMSSEQLASCLAETKGLLMSSGTLGEATVITLDTTVGFAKKIVNPSQIQLVGGGGTDMGKGFTYMKEKNIKSDITIVMTDGYTPWPNEKPINSRIIILLVGDSVNKTELPWAKIIKVEKTAVENSYDY